MQTTPELYLADWARMMTIDANQAKSSIAISALSCLPPRASKHGDWPALWQSWIDAAARGVRVELYLPAPLKSAGATITNQKTADTAQRHGIACHLIPGPNLLHCKSMVIDQLIIWIGSGNFTAAAANHNHEAYMRHRCPSMARQMQDRWEAIR